MQLKGKLIVVRLATAPSPVFFVGQEQSVDDATTSLTLVGRKVSSKGGPLQARSAVKECTFPGGYWAQVVQEPVADLAPFLDPAVKSEHSTSGAFVNALFTGVTDKWLPITTLVQASREHREGTHIKTKRKDKQPRAATAMTSSSKP